MNFELTVLGTSSAVPTSVRFPSAHVLNAYEQFFLIDCGEGTQMQLRKFKIKFARINHIFISHLHGDHYFGIYGLLSSFALQKRKNELHIYAPEELRKLVKVQLKYLDLGFPISFHYLNFDRKKKILDTKHIEVYSFPLKHSISTCGFLFQEKERERNIIKAKIEKYQLGLREIVKLKSGNNVEREDGTVLDYNDFTNSPSKARSYAYCSDTQYYNKIADYVKDVDLLYHEATYMDIDKALAKKTMHSTASDAAKIASKANANKLILGHYSGRYYDLKPMLIEASKYHNNVVLAHDGFSFSLPYKK
ncbi:MAG: ribonuclease Z [Bacteroidales bacterium]|nr:ribonuclease Z [Bacteroidales bacterium]